MTTMLMDPFAYWFEQGRWPHADPAPRTFVPSTDLLSGERDVKVAMDVPGLSVDDLEIELTDGTLTIRGERRYPYREHTDSHELNRLERGFGRFERTLRVPRDVDAGAIEASIDAGVLTLSIPLPDSRRPHRIEVRRPRPEAIDVGDGGPADREGEGTRALAGASA
ncbi:MAG TPA: Hsp20/alpha crystallin family protein [Solirubrobacterales bacterium]|jgi:HSP20 family protein